MKSVGIIGLGTYLPPTVRRNDWWPADIVATWHDRMAARATNGQPPDVSKLSSGARRTLAAMSELASDPFRGSIERRVMGDDMTTSKMEAVAAREAMQRANVTPADIDVVLAQTPVPELPMVNNAAITHGMLELPSRCLAIGTEAACNAFALHATIAQALIASGQARNVLSLHSSAITRVHGPTEPHSAWWGDGAAAAVFGPVADGRGILGAVHHTDGNRCDALALGVPGKQYWFEEGAVTTHAINRESTRNMLFGMVDRGAAAIATALTQAGLDASAVDFFASHQSTPWLAREAKAEAGLDRAQTMITFPMLANMNSVNVPFILAQAERQGMVKDGSLVTTFSGGLGETWSSLVYRWGR